MGQLWNRDEIIGGLASLAESGPLPRDGYELRPPLRPEAVLAVERGHGIRLPESYRSFVLEVGDGGAGPHHGLWSLHRAAGSAGVGPPYGPGYLATPFPYTRRVTTKALDDEIGARHMDYDDLLTGSMIIAEIGGGAFMRLVVTGPAAGQVWREELPFDGGALTPGPDFGDWYLRWLRRVGAVDAAPGGRRRLIGWHSPSLEWRGPGSEQGR
ncbi:SMI1/KNR4 family protein [Actinomadura chokoriensis]|uniref:SMI1/KNR4 family protein n=1 Tax=Actinomadura chokoriensis TaxID=454156 RepID=A0ABV4QQC0_9ACTN